MTIQHTALNYELADYGSYVPDTPTKLYNDTRVKEGEFSVYRLPNRETAAVSLSVIFSIVIQTYLNMPQNKKKQILNQLGMASICVKT